MVAPARQPGFKWGWTLQSSGRALARHPLRTLLSVSAMAIGIAAVAVLAALGAGAERALQEALELLGRNLLVINTTRTQTNALRGGSRPVQTLERADGQAIVEEVAGIVRAAPIKLGVANLRVGRLRFQATVNASTAELEAIKNIRLLDGRFLDDQDVIEHRRVTVIGARIVRELFSGEWPVGEVIEVDRVPFTIIGVMAGKGVTQDGSTEDDQIVIPITAMQRATRRRFVDTESIDRLFVQAASKEVMGGAKSDIRSLLRRRHGLETTGAADDFEIRNQNALLAAQAKTRGSFTRLVGGLAALALGLGGVGLFAVCWLSVSERRVEIGLRLSVGARRRDILWQFLTEAMLVATLGGACGVALGAMGILAGEHASGWPLALTWPSVWMPFVISLVIALFCGSTPAWQASRLDPVLALGSS